MNIISVGVYNRNESPREDCRPRAMILIVCGSVRFCYVIATSINISYSTRRIHMQYLYPRSNKVDVGFHLIASIVLNEH